MTVVAATARRPRFDAVERAVHWATAVLVLGCVATGAALSIGPLATLVGRRALLRDLHVGMGLLLVVPLIVGLAGPWATQLRRDVRRLDRFDAHDRRWLRTAGRVARHGDGRDRTVTADGGVVAGAQHSGWGPAKFHPGQKLNAAATGAAVVALTLTGIVLWQFDPFPLGVRRGATFVHDWAAALFTLLVAGHVLVSLNDREAMRGMLGGDVDVEWAARKHPRWEPGEP